jgi:glycosyltransferase involved in cell wall biosynthesis
MLRILVLNWKDFNNPNAGGAEEYIYQIFTRLAKKGIEITLFTSCFNGANRNDNINNIKIIRRGNKFTVYLLGFLFYIMNRYKYDVVIESINTVPFLTPFYVKKPIYTIIHHLGGKETYDLEVGKTFSSVLTVIQKFVPLLYTNTNIITVSESTKKELMNINKKIQSIDIVKNGIVLPPEKIIINKFEKPTIIYFGRVKKLKRVELIINAFNQVKTIVPEAILIIAGRGDDSYYDFLKNYVKSKSIKDVNFLGALNQEDKLLYLCKSWVYAIASIKEGWGISVLEANSVGLPVVAYNVPGLVDSIKDSKSGFLIEDGDEYSYARAIIKLLLDTKLRCKMSQDAIFWANHFSWDRSAIEFESLLNLTVHP